MKEIKDLHILLFKKK